MTLVIKLGGARAIDPGPMVDDVATLTANGESVVIVHGGSTAIDQLLTDLNHEPDYVETPDGVVGRFTDSATMDLVTMALASVNNQLVTTLHEAGVDAIGLTGVDGKLVTGSWRSAVRVVEDGRKRIRRGAHAGTIEAVDGDLLAMLLDAGYVPVITVPMLGYDDSALAPVNVDTDRLAAAIGAALDAQLVILTDVDGVYADPNDSSSVIELVDSPPALDALETAATGFMRRKVMAATEALEDGADRVIITTANAPHPILTGLDGTGTHLVPSAVVGQNAGEVDAA